MYIQVFNQIVHSGLSVIELLSQVFNSSLIWGVQLKFNP